MNKDYVCPMNRLRDLLDDMDAPYVFKMGPFDKDEYADPAPTMAAYMIGLESRLAYWFDHDGLYIDTSILF